MVRRSHLIETPGRIPQSRPNLIGFATLARLAYYRGDPLIDQAVKGFGWGEGAWTIPATPLEPQVLSLDYDDYKIIVFEGTTTSAQTWEYCTSPLNVAVGVFPGKILQGFYSVFQTVWPKVEALLQDIGKRKVVFIGHSLGAAMAALSSYQWEKYSKENFHCCVTFGCPRIGNGEWVHGLDFAWYRVSNDIDPVTHVPPRTLLIGNPFSGADWWKIIEYDHGGYAISLDSEGNIKNGTAPSLGLADLFAALGQNNWSTSQLAEPHGMDDYVFNLSKTPGPFRYWRHKYFSEVNNELNEREFLEWRMLGFND